MATIKAFTDIKQSKKLVEILPVESADMFYTSLNRDYPWIWIDKHLMEVDDIPCWSLAALLDVLESEIDGEGGETYQLNIEKDGTWWNVWYREKYDEADAIETASTEELIDAVVEMISTLKEKNLL